MYDFVLRKHLRSEDSRHLLPSSHIPDTRLQSRSSSDFLACRHLELLREPPQAGRLASTFIYLLVLVYIPHQTYLELNAIYISIE